MTEFKEFLLRLLLINFDIIKEEGIYYYIQSYKRTYAVCFEEITLSYVLTEDRNKILEFLGIDKKYDDKDIDMYDIVKHITKSKFYSPASFSFKNVHPYLKAEDSTAIVRLFTVFNTLANNNRVERSNYDFPLTDAIYTLIVSASFNLPYLKDWVENDKERKIYKPLALDKFNGYLFMLWTEYELSEGDELGAIKKEFADSVEATGESMHSYLNRSKDTEVRKDFLDHYNAYNMCLSR